MPYNRLGQQKLRQQISWWVVLTLGLSLLSVLGGRVPAAEGAELSEIQRRGYLIVGVKDNLRPLGFTDPAGELVGLEIDLAHWLAERILGDAQAVMLQPLANQDRLSALLNDEVDLVVARLTFTVSRSRLVDFSQPYYFDGTAFITRSGSLQRLSDFQHQTIAVLNDSNTIAIVRSHLPTAQLVGVDSYEAAKALLDMDQAVAFAADASVLTGWAQEYPSYRLVPILLSAEALAVAMPRGLQYDSLRQQVNRAIEQWQTEGRLRERVQYWELPDAGIPSRTREMLENLPGAD
ncbi:transporter substrate-binding domain-containing protein [Egbenema bharatensis]|uniref:transporter substrate-binding domain-containing protein n=1 Tax=Egbenema bharatensis TaxID=3463334 RepID=UPI003A852E22